MTTRRSSKSRGVGTTDIELCNNSNSSGIVPITVTTTGISTSIRKTRSTDDVRDNINGGNDDDNDDDDNNGKLKITKHSPSSSLGLLTSITATTTSSTTALTTTVPIVPVVLQQSSTVEMNVLSSSNLVANITVGVPMRYDSIQTYSTDVNDGNDTNINGRYNRQRILATETTQLEIQDQMIQQLQPQQQHPQHWQSNSFNENDQILQQQPIQHQKDNTATRPVVSWFVIKITIIASIGGILFGYDLGVISNALPQLTKNFNLNDGQQELVVSILYIGGGIGAMIGGSLCDSIGRKTTILVTDIIFLFGSVLLSCFAINYTIILLGRIILGIGIAISGIADVSYLHEIAPIHVRGAIVSVNEACISLGFLISFCIGSIYGTNEQHGWKYMFGWSGLFAIIQFIGMLSLPESPKWLQECGKYNESQIALRIINSDYVYYSELDNRTNAPENYHHQQQQLPQNEKYQSDHLAMSILPAIASNNCKTETSEIGIDGIFNTIATNSTSPNNILSRFCQLPIQACTQSLSFLKVCFVQYYKQTMITLFLAITQQFCGQTNVISYAPSILARVSSSTSSTTEVMSENNNNNNNNRFLQEQVINDNNVSSFIDSWSTLSIGIVKFIVTVLVIWKIEHIGRRTLLLCGMSIISIGLLLLTIAFADISSLNITSNTSTTNASISLAGVILVVTGYSMSFGPLSWLLTSELFPTEIRGRALGASTIVTYLCASIVTNTFLTSQRIFGSSTVFAFYMSITIIGMIFAYLAIPDTGGINYDDIATILDTMPWWKYRR
jgi:MFS family permease